MCMFINAINGQVPVSDYALDYILNCLPDLFIKTTETALVFRFALII